MRSQRKLLMLLAIAAAMLMLTSHENINKISVRYGEPKPFIMEIKPVSLKTPPELCTPFI